MAVTLTIELSNLIALCFEVLLYGAFIVLFIYATYVLLFQRRKINRPMVVASFLMFILITAVSTAC